MRSLFMLLCFVPLSMHAMQNINIKEGVVTNVSVGVNKLNQIIIKDDRIKSIKSIDSSEFSYDKDETQGHIYIRPLTGGKPAHVFVATEKGKNYSITFTPSQIGGQTIRFLSREDVRNIKIDSDSSYEAEIANLLIAMRGGAELLGFDVSLKAIKIKGCKFERCGGEVKAEKVATYSGNGFKGEVINLVNKTKQTAFNLNFLKNEKTLAITMLRNDMAPGDRATIYRVERDV